jgi:hypothetical protein
MTISTASNRPNESSAAFFSVFKIFDIFTRCLKVLENSPSIDTVDVTGGAPGTIPINVFRDDHCKKIFYGLFKVHGIIYRML